MPLHDLDAIDWAALTHAYGAASDVPGLLRGLLAPEPKVREDAISELFGTIWHQGTVYSATAAAVPFLYELLTAPEVHDKASIAVLLACVAEGVGYLEVHAAGGFGERNCREILARKGKTLEAELEREAAEVEAVRRAASAGLRHLPPYLNDPEPDVRRSVASALGHFPEHASWILPALDAALASETDTHVRNELIASKAGRTRR
jgi:HEAT repeat protein